MCRSVFQRQPKNAEARNTATLDFVWDVSAKPGSWFLRPLIQKTPVPAPNWKRLAASNAAEVSA